MKALIAFLLGVILLSASAHGQCVLSFGFVGCAPCQEMKPIVSELVSEGYDIRHIDRASRPDLVSHYRVRQYPTFIVLDDNEAVLRVSGRLGRNSLRALCRAAQYAALERRLRALEGRK